VLNIPQPPTCFSIYDKTTGSAVADVSVSLEAVAENEKDESSHVTACFDGFWQKHGHTSLNGITSAISVDRGKVLDIEIVSKSFFVCHTNPASQHECKRTMKQ
jgi:hypothetical protein